MFRRSIARMPLTTAALALILTCLGCPIGTERLMIYADPLHVDNAAAFAATIPYDDLQVLASDDPVAAAQSGQRKAVRVAIVQDLDCRECYRIEGEGRVYVVHGDGQLGWQYGLAHLLELWGFRFHHPFDTVVPDRLVELDGHADLGVTFEPEMSLRGIQLHTLHPIEGLWAVWVPGDDSLDRATRIVDWLIKNRGNYLQWVALDDIEGSASHAAWQALTREIVQVAHARGIEVGVGVQLFSSGNLQQAFDLVDHTGTPEEMRPAMEQRLALIADGVAWDRISLSFGEFYAEEPEVFLEAVNLAYEVMQEQLPGVEVVAPIHVGNYDDLTVEYQGDTYQYYFLVQFADPAIVPWVHSVMYYNLFEDAGGAYLHDEFDEHRAFLLQRLAAGERVAYFPESAYWCAFDNPVPTYLPLYLHSRWLDMDRIRAAAADSGHAGLDEHVLFSSGWEWGYWQFDVATLRMTYRLGGGWEEQVRQMYAPWGAEGGGLATAIIDLAELQHRALIEDRLAAYLAGRDAFMDVGYAVGVVSMPDRYTADQVAAMTLDQRQAFRATVVEPLARLADDTRAIADRTADLAVQAPDPWFDEVADGARIDQHRAEFAAAIYSALLEYLETGSDGGFLAHADASLTQARAVVDRRHAALHDPAAARLLDPDDNPTIYHFGYLRWADELCYWHKERIEAAQVIEGSDEVAPGCAW